MNPALLLALLLTAAMAVLSKADKATALIPKTKLDLTDILSTAFMLIIAMLVASVSTQIIGRMEKKRSYGFRLFISVIFVIVGVMISMAVGGMIQSSLTGLYPAVFGN